MIRRAFFIDVSLFGGYFIFVFFFCGNVFLHANTFAQDYRINYDDGLITLSADKVEIKTILSDLAEKTNVVIHFSSGLKKQITIKLSNVSVRNAFRRLLRGQNYAIIYSASSPHARDSISEVHVLPSQRGGRRRTRYRTGGLQEKRIEKAVRNAERQLDSLRNRLTRVNRGSREERRIQRQIRSMEKAVERLQERLQR